MLIARLIFQIDQTQVLIAIPSAVAIALIGAVAGWLAKRRSTKRGE